MLTSYKTNNRENKADADANAGGLAYIGTKNKISLSKHNYVNT